jgi:NADPH:quinone reductase-like Zn-dependent oxidoreductase
MAKSIPESMKAVQIDRFGGPEVLELRTVPVPMPEADEVVIRLESAGIGAWDPWVREGTHPAGVNGGFPLVLGNDGAGTVVAVGEAAQRFSLGDCVYAFADKGGCYAEYVAVKQEGVALVPSVITPREAGALAADGVTALQGLDDQLELRAGETLMIFGASGGMGHIAVQIAKRMGARVLAVASGLDGVELVRRLGADMAVDGHRDDVGHAARSFAPDGLDAALVLVNGEGLSDGLAKMKPGGRVACPSGIEPRPEVPNGVKLLSYSGTPVRETLERLNRVIGNELFHVELGRTYPLEEAATAHAQIYDHHLGKLAFAIRA